MSWVCSKIINHKMFDNVILLVIIWNTIILCIQDPTRQSESPALDTMEQIFLWTYLAECILKILGMGFILNKGSYLREGWNILDFVIVTTSFIPLFLGSDSGVNLTVLRSFRVLRPLRTISNIRSLKVILVTLFSAVPQLINTIIILLFFLLVFAIGGVQLYMGKDARRHVHLSFHPPPRSSACCHPLR